MGLLCAATGLSLSPNNTGIHDILFETLYSSSMTVNWLSFAMVGNNYICKFNGPCFLSIVLRMDGLVATIISSRKALSYRMHDLSYQWIVEVKNQNIASS